MPCVSSPSKLPQDHKEHHCSFLYKKDSVMRLPLQNDCLFSELQWLFWKLTFKLCGNSANFCFAFRSCFVSSGSVISCFTSSLLSREEQVSWVTVLLVDSVASLLDKEHRTAQVFHALACSCQRPKINVQQRNRTLRSCLAFSLSSLFQAALLIHCTTTSCITKLFSCTEFMHMVVQPRGNARFLSCISKCPWVMGWRLEAV